MKQIAKILLLLLSFVLILGCSILPVFAEGENTPDANDLGFPVEYSYYDLATGNHIHVLEDGTKYNSTTKQWILEEKEGLSFETNTDRMVSSLQYMWQGMLCIFVVIGVIILSVYGLNYVFGKLEEKKKQKEKEEN